VNKYEEEKIEEKVEELQEKKQNIVNFKLMHIIMA
jgi:hypothetical protein